MKKDIEKYKEFLLEEIKRFYKEHGRIPKSRDMYNHNGYPSKEQYKKHFGNLIKAIEISGIEVDELTYKLSNRESINKDDVITKLKEYTDTYIVENKKFPTQREIYENTDLTQYSVELFFKSVEDMFIEIGYVDYIKMKESFFKQKLMDDYIKMYDIKGFWLNSREIDAFQKEHPYLDTYVSSVYIDVFGSLSSFQREFGVIPTRFGRSATKEDIVKGLKKLRHNKETPLIIDDIDYCTYLPSYNCCLKALGYSGMPELNEKLFNEKTDRVKYTKTGTMCLSDYEYTIARTLEKYEYRFKKDELYNKYGIDIARLTTDFVIFDNNKNPVFIEIFGIVGRKEYDNKVMLKKRLCKRNGVKLISLYPKDFYGMSHEKWHKYLKEELYT